MVFLAHNFAFQQKPEAVPEAAITVLDEAFWQSGIRGNDKLHPVQMAVSSLHDERTGRVTGWSRERLLWLRRRAADALERQDEGGLLREAFEATGLTAESAKEWLDLEWETKPKVKLGAGMERAEVLGLLRDAAAEGFTRYRPMLARYVRDLLAGTDARSTNATLVRNAPLGREQGTGDAFHFAWKEEFAEWIADIPKLIPDATTHPDVIRAWAPELEVVDIEVQAPHQRVRQVVGREFGRAFFEQNPENIRRLADLVMLELAQASGEVLVIAQMAVEEALRREVHRRCEGRTPDRLALAHHGAITGLDRHRDAERLVVVGRPATDRADGERLAELVKGGRCKPLRTPRTPAGPPSPPASAWRTAAASPCASPGTPMRRWRRCAGASPRGRSCRRSAGHEGSSGRRGSPSLSRSSANWPCP